MKKYLLIFVVVFLCTSAYAQQEYYYYKGVKQFLTLDKTKVNITAEDKFQMEKIEESNIKLLVMKKSSINQDAMFGQISFHSEIKEKEYNEIITSLCNDKYVIAVHPNFITSYNLDLGMSSYFYVKLRKDTDYEVLNKMAMQTKTIIVEQNEFMPLWFTLRCTKETKCNTLETANYFYETGLFASALPDFLSNDAMCANDPYFPQQWGLNNASNLDLDINACEAWEISQGEGVKVAVIDDAIKLTHPDLSANIYPLSYNTATGTSPSAVFTHPHGTLVAGVIGAVKDNHFQVTGVAPKCTLIAISTPLENQTDEYRMKRANGINWAWKQGSDVINNSWSSPYADYFEDAIDSALIHGRNGKGCVLVFAAGNTGSPVVYPASRTDVLSVGGIDTEGYRAITGFWESNYGYDLDIVAPSTSVLSTSVIYSVDSVAFAFGTSYATPFVSGVAALMLSVSPDLTAQEVKNIIESNAQKVSGYDYQIYSNRPNGKWHEEMGYGLVDAYAAVYAAICKDDFTNKPVTTDTKVIGCTDLNVKDVSVANSAKLKLEAPGKVIISKDFQMQLGSELKIK